MIEDAAYLGASRVGVESDLVMGCVKRVGFKRVGR